MRLAAVATRRASIRSIACLKNCVFIHTRALASPNLWFGVVFLVIALYFVYRSFYKMRIK